MITESDDEFYSSLFNQGRQLIEHLAAMQAMYDAEDYLDIVLAVTITDRWLHTAGAGFSEGAISECLGTWLAS